MPLELAMVGNKGQVIRGGAFKWNVVEACLLVQHADPLSPPEMCLVLSHVIELVLVLSCPFIDQDDVLTHPVGLLRLDASD